jgi:uncharacterized RDD family membrane protein YckC
MAQEMEQDFGQTRSAPRGRAGFGKRLVALIIDSIILNIVAYLVASILGLDPGDTTQIALFSSANLMSTIMSLLYFGFLEGSTGQTIGKKAMGIRVCDIATGEAIGVPRAMGRYVARIVSALPIFLGYFWMLWDKEKQTWHDKLTNAVVVPADESPVEQSAA